MKALYKIFLKSGRLKYVAIEGVQTSFQAVQVRKTIEGNNSDIAIIELVSLSEIPTYNLAEVEEKNLIRDSV